MTTVGRSRTARPDAACVQAVDLAREAAEEVAEGPVGEHLGHRTEGERMVTHVFAATDPGYRGWQWSVTVVRASRAKEVTVNEVVLLPADGALLAPPWVPYAERVGAGDIVPGVLMPTPDDDPRLEPGYTGGEQAADADPALESATRALAVELGLGRERVLSPYGRDRAAERWLRGEGGPHTPMAEQAPASCVSCAYFTRLGGSLGTIFGACANEYSPSDGRVVSFDHGCGGHSDVVDEHRPAEPSGPVWDSVSWDTAATLFD